MVLAGGKNIQENGNFICLQLLHQGGNQGGLTAVPSMRQFSAAASPSVRCLT